LPRPLVLAVVESVERAGGDTHDLRELLAAWQRLASDHHGRLDQLHRANRLAAAASAATFSWLDRDGGHR
jgi:hypothetical protein